MLCKTGPGNFPSCSLTLGFCPTNLMVLVRLPQKYTRESKSQQNRISKNPDPILHPFQQQREYVRALNAAKLERMFSKPFLASLGEGHIEGVYAMARDGEGVGGKGTIPGGYPGELTRLISGSADGVIKMWNLASQKKQWEVQSESFVKGLSFIPRKLTGDLLDGLGYEHSMFVSVGSDLRVWRTNQDKAIKIYAQKYALTGIDHHRSRPLFATSSSEQVDCWSLDRPDAIQSFKWGSESVLSCKFNPAHVDVMAATGADRSIALYDLRLRSATAKVILQMRSNSVCWNPQEVFYFTAACEDHRAYSFDMRHLDKPVNVFTGHVGAVMDVDYAPTGAEIVTAGYDKTIRIFDVKHGTARDVYHTSRMQRVHCVRFTGDATYVASGSDDGSVRLWRSVAHERVGVKSERERTQLDYSEALKDQYQHFPEVNRILKHRRLPKSIKSAARTEKEIRDGMARKEERRRNHAKKGTEVPKSNIRTDAVVKTLH